MWKVTGAVAIAIAALVSCYDAPRPACGFWCGSAGECPSGYLCDQGTGRCFANGVDPADFGMPCPDAGAAPVNQLGVPTASGPFESCAAGLPRTQCVDVAFSERVYNVTPSTLYIVDETGRTLFGFILPSSDFVDAVSIDLSGDPLQFGALYTLVATRDIRDGDDRPLIPYTRQFRRTPQSVDDVVAFRDPAPGTTGVDVDRSIYLSLLVQVPALNETTLELFRAGEKVSAEVLSSEPTTSFAEMRPRRQMAPETVHTIRWFSASLSSDVEWSFTTGLDRIPPNVRSNHPFPGAAGILVDDTISMTFDEEPGIVSYRLETAAGVPLTGDLAVFPGEARITFDPHVQLAPTAEYRWELVVTDTYGNTRTNTINFSTTVDAVPPALASSVPAEGTTGVPSSTTIRATFDEPTLAPAPTSFLVTRGGTPVPGTITTEDAGRTWVFTPSEPLLPGATHTVQIVDVTDAFGNSASYLWVFLTAP